MSHKLICHQLQEVILLIFLLLKCHFITTLVWKIFVITFVFSPLKKYE